jgi:hypothetical protein
MASTLAENCALVAALKRTQKKGYMCENMPKNLSYDTKVTYSASPRSSASI